MAVRRIILNKSNPPILNPLDCGDRVWKKRKAAWDLETFRLEFAHGEGERHFGKKNKGWSNIQVNGGAGGSSFRSILTGKADGQVGNKILRIAYYA